MKPGENSTGNHELSNNGKIIIDQNVPIEELMGSVTAYNNVEGSDSKSLQLRTSARVFKKMKLDSANSVPVTPIVIPEKKEPVKEETKPEVKKSYRPLWTTEDKNLFFEALNEYGKDFEAIHLYISNKLKKKGLPEPVIKTKDQIRHLYYRTWHKISKHLKFSEDIKKIAQELYGLINYGELRKKITFVSEKTCVKLNELIYRGSVAIRVKGKTIRIRTPMCRALRKLNQLDEKHDDLKLPSRVTVELQAKDMKTWFHVQKMAQNPRVKTAVPLQKRLSSVIQCLTERWKTQSAINFENVIKSTNEDTKDCLPDEKIIDEKKAILEPTLRLSPLSNCDIVIPTINLSEYLTTQSICLNTYEERIGVKVPGELTYQNLFSNFRTSSKGSTRKGGTKRPRNESTSEKLAKQLSVNQTDTNDNCVQDCKPSANVNQVVDQVVNTLLALQNQDGTDNVEVKNEVTHVKVEVPEEAEIKKEHDIGIIRKGWTIHDCGTLTIGDLYLMFGCDSKILLEYSWDSSEESKMNILQSSNSEKLTENEAKTQESCSEVAVDNTEEEINNIEKSNELTSYLKRLISIAKLHYRKNIVKCPCGHVCNGYKQNIVKPKPIINKVAKVVENKPQDISEVTITNVVSTIGELNATPKITTTFHTQAHQVTPTPIFRIPNAPNDLLRAQLDSIQRLKPRYCNRKGRPRAKQVVVERKLPILANKGDTTGRQILQMNIVSQDNLPQQRIIAPKVMEISGNNLVHPDFMRMTTVNVSNEVDTFNVLSQNQNFDNIQIRQSIEEPSLITDNATTPSRVASPTNISDFMEMNVVSQNNENMLINTLPKSQLENEPSFAGILSNTIQTPTPPTSPSRILKENDNQWLNSEVVDFSLSSLLGQLDSPAKMQQPGNIASNEDSRLGLPQDVDAQLHSLLTENSLDYMAKFADLAAQVTTESKK